MLVYMKETALRYRRQQCKPEINVGNKLPV